MLIEKRNFNKVAEIEDMFCIAFISLSASVVKPKIYEI